MPALSVALALALLAKASPADDDAARRAAVVAHVGAKTITAGELEDRMANVPAFQLATFGTTPAQVKRAFLEQVLVKELLLAQGAEARHVDADLAVSQALARAKSDATLRALRAQIGPASAIPMSDVQRYYDDNRARYDSPERYNLWRILCKTREEAVAVLDAAKKDGSVGKFTTLARDHSADKATFLRGGNLGFVTVDGTSNETGLKVDPAVVKAALDVKDGQIVPQPIVEGSGWAVVWRRGTVGASHRAVEEVAPQIRDTLHKQRIEDAQKKLLDDLRAAHVSQLDDGLLNGIEISQSDGNVVPRRRPGQVAPLNAPTSGSAPSGPQPPQPPEPGQPPPPPRSPQPPAPPPPPPR